MMLVVLFALVGCGVGSWAPVQPAHLPALLLDPHGRPLDTAEVVNARALHLQAKALEHGYAPLAHSYVASPLVHALAPAVSHQSRVDYTHAPLLAHSTLAGLSGHYLKKRSLGYLVAPIATNYVGGSALTHQSRVDVHSSPAVVAHSVVAPVVSTYSAVPAYGHLLKKRSLALAHGISPIVSYSPIAVAAIPSAVSHQSRVDVHTSPAIVSQSIVAPVVSHSVVSPVVSAYSAWPAYGHGHYLKKRSLGYLTPIIAPVSTNYVGGAAVTHESRVDVHSAPALVSQSVISPLVSAYSALPTYGHGHLLKKRSLALAHGISPIVSYTAPIVAHAIPSAVSHQSRVDVHSSPAIVSQSIVAPVVSHSVVSPVVPYSHSAVWSAPQIYNSLALSHW